MRYRHRCSRDIDIFVRHPQPLVFVSPRLNPVAERIADDCVEGPGFVKLIRLEGEIGVVAAPNLTEEPFQVWRIERRAVRVETAVEIVARKMWHRAQTVTARDLFGLSLVIEKEPKALAAAARFLVRHCDEFLAQLRRRAEVLRAQFEAIDTLDYRPTFEAAAERARSVLLGVRVRGRSSPR